MVRQSLGSKALPRVMNYCQHLQMYNIKAPIGQDYLEQVQLFTEYGRHAIADDEVGTIIPLTLALTIGSPIKNFIYLVRDWARDDDDYPLGLEGGAKYLSHIL